MKKVAIIIGHRSAKQGAYSAFLDRTEYQYNKAVAELLTDVADVYERPNIPFASEAFIIKQLVKEVNKHNYDLVISLHFNSFHNEKAHGVTALHYITSKFGKLIANEFVKMVSDDFKIRKRDLIPISNKTQRGGTLICGLNATTVLVEPFFGSNEYDACQFYQKEAEYAKLLRDLIHVSGHLKPYNT